MVLDYYYYYYYWMMMLDFQVTFSLLVVVVVMVFDWYDSSWFVLRLDFISQINYILE